MIHTFVALLTHKHESGHNRIVYRFLFVYLKRTGCGYIKMCIRDRKMNGSHEGLSRQYEVSCDELDFLANIGHRTDGVLGARMMGGGFGGCTINLVRAEAYDGYLAEATDRFAHRFGHAPRAVSYTHLCGRSCRGCGPMRTGRLPPGGRPTAWKR